METAFTKIVTDLNGRDHLLIEGRLISLIGETTEVNMMVAEICSALRNAGREPQAVAMMAASH